MKTISHKTLYQVVFFLCVAIPFLNNYELTIATWLIALLSTITRKYSLNIVKLVVCFVVILVVAFFSSFFNDEASYNFVRDLAYLIKPIVGLLLGYQLMKRLHDSFFTTIIKTGVVIAIIHLSIVIFTFLRLKTLSVNILRENCGFFSDYEVYVIIFLVFHKNFGYAISKQKLYLYGFLLTISSVLYVSRTNILQFLVLFLALKGYFKITVRSVSVMFLTTVVVLASYSAIYYSNPSRTGKGLEAFLFKIKNIPNEAFKTKVNSNNWKDFNDNYRSYESIITLKQVTQDGIFSTVFGKGLGSTINLGQEIVTTDGTKVKHIPILHNGFSTVFLKSGLFGLFFLMFFLAMLTRNSSSILPEVKTLNELILGSSIFLIMSTWVFLGLYFKVDNKSILIGMFICYKEIILKNHVIKST